MTFNAGDRLLLIPIEAAKHANYLERVMPALEVLGCVLRAGDWRPRQVWRWRRLLPLLALMGVPATARRGISTATDTITVTFDQSDAFVFPGLEPHSWAPPAEVPRQLPKSERTWSMPARCFTLRADSKVITFHPEPDPS